MKFQPGILMDLPAHARFLTFRLRAGAEIDEALDLLVDLVDGTHLVAGIGASMLGEQVGAVPGLREFPSYAGHGVEIPSTPGSLWCWVRGEDRAGVFIRAHSLERKLSEFFEVVDVADSFRFGPPEEARDLTGYIDGTENPQGDAAVQAAFVDGQGAGLDGSSFVGVLRWRHDFSVWDSLDRQQRDHVIGRSLTSNEELEDAPISAHVKRAEQEDFDPPAVSLRRSMPWASGREGGILFTSFCSDLYAFEAPLKRMTGQDDGVVDSLFQFSRPLTGAYFWCPPLKEGELDLSIIGL